MRALPVIALVSVTVLSFVAGHYQWLLPYPSMDPFDDQWEMKTRWMARAADTLDGGMCGYYNWVFERPGGRVLYQYYSGDPTAVVAKGAAVTIGAVGASDYHCARHQPVVMAELLERFDPNGRIDEFMEDFGYAPAGGSRAAFDRIGVRCRVFANGRSDTVAVYLDRYDHPAPDSVIVVWGAYKGAPEHEIRWRNHYSARALMRRFRENLPWVP